MGHMQIAGANVAVKIWPSSFHCRCHNVAYNLECCSGVAVVGKKNGIQWETHLNLKKRNIYMETLSTSYAVHPRWRRWCRCNVKSLCTPPWIIQVHFMYRLNLLFAESQNVNALIRPYFHSASIKRHTGSRLLFLRLTPKYHRRINAHDWHIWNRNSKLKGHFLVECGTNGKCVARMTKSAHSVTKSKFIHSLHGVT